MASKSFDRKVKKLKFETSQEMGLIRKPQKKKKI